MSCSGGTTTTSTTTSTAPTTTPAITRLPQPPPALPLQLHQPTATTTSALLLYPVVLCELPCRLGMRLSSRNGAAERKFYLDTIYEY
jgi:hypothetical protein